MPRHRLLHTLQAFERAFRMAVCPLALPMLLSGCFVGGIHPRPGEILREGEVRVGGNCSVATVAFSTVKLADGGKQEGFSGFRDVIHPIAWITFFMYNSMLDIGWSPTSWLELDWGVGYQEMGMDIRTPLLSERNGAPLSIAASAGAWYRPWMDSAAPWFRAGSDLSRNLGPYWKLFLDLQTSWGPESQAMLPADKFIRECGSFGDEGCGEYAPSPVFYSVRNELRATAAVGFEVLIPPSCYNQEQWPCEDGYTDAPIYLSVSAAPYYIAYADDGTLLCSGCSYNEVTDFSSRWGVSLMLTVARAFGNTR